MKKPLPPYIREVPDLPPETPSDNLSNRKIGYIILGIALTVMTVTGVSVGYMRFTQREGVRTEEFRKLEEFRKNEEERKLEEKLREIKKACEEKCSDDASSFCKDVSGRGENLNCKTVFKYECDKNC